jgi:hypothetical protein
MTEAGPECPPLLARIAPESFLIAGWQK